MNTDYELRDWFIFGEYDKSQYIGNVRYFHEVYYKIDALADHDFIDPYYRDNGSPSFSEFSEYLKGLDVIYDGYVTNDDRMINGVIIKGFDAIIPDRQCDKLCEIVNNFYDGDEFYIEHENYQYRIHVWYD